MATAHSTRNRVSRPETTGKLIRFQDQLSPKERKKYNPLADELLLRHGATIDRIDKLLDEFGMYLQSPNGITMARRDHALANVTVEDLHGSPKIDLREDFAADLSVKLGEILERVGAAKRRIDKAIKSGELPRPPIVAFQWVKDGQVLERFDSATSAGYRMQYHGGDVFNEFADGSTERCENSLVESIRHDMAKKAAGVEPADNAVK